MEIFNASCYLIDRQVEAGNGSRLAVAGPGGQRTYAELAADVRAAGAGLSKMGLRPEERIVLFCSDGPELLTAFLAALRIGAVPVPVSTMYRDTELAELLCDSRAAMVMATPEFADTARSAVRIARDTDKRWRALILVDDPAAFRRPDGTVETSWSTVARGSKASDSAGHEEPPYASWPDSPAFWLYTSGTTGVPKAAMHRHGSVRTVAETYGRQVLGIGPDDRCFSVAKLFFAYGLGNAAFFPLSVGATTILDPARPTPAGVAARLLENRPTLFFGVPTFYAALLASDVPSDAFASVRLAVSAGEALPAELYRRFTERFGVDVIDGIGSTEALHIFLSNRPGEVRPGTSGVEVPGYDARLVDDTGAEVPDGTAGHLQIRGESLATGYWCRTDVTRATFTDGWMRTGDTYVRSADGFYTCLGRSNDMIKAGGIWVSPAEVEDCLRTDPSVAAVAVVAVPDADGLDKPVACVVAAPGAEIDPEKLIAHCREHLAAFKRPRHVLVFDSLPTTATGKLRRFAVREQALERLGPERIAAHDHH
jgi:benzoate-CoA ligase family protein